MEQYQSIADQFYLSLAFVSNGKQVDKWLKKDFDRKALQLLTDQQWKEIRQCQEKNQVDKNANKKLNRFCSYLKSLKYVQQIETGEVKENGWEDQDVQERID